MGRWALSRCFRLLVLGCSRSYRRGFLDGVSIMVIDIGDDVCDVGSEGPWSMEAWSI